MNIVRVAVLVAAVLSLTAGSAPARCPKECRQVLQQDATGCRTPCAKGKARKSCRVTCRRALKADMATCRGATNPTPPNCGETTSTTSTITTTTTTSTTLGSGCFADTGDGTIHDTCTGLQWEKKTTAVKSGVNPADLHDVDNLYAWAGSCSLFGEYCQPNAAAATTCAAHADGGTAGCKTCESGTCIVDVYDRMAITTVWDWLNQVNAANFAGHNDWRLPSEGGHNSPATGSNELETILIYYCGFDTVCINSIFGPTLKNNYWSASTDPADPFGAWSVLFDGLGTANFPEFFPLSVRAVR